MKDIITVNNIPVTIFAQYTTGDETSFFASKFVGEYSSMKELNADMPKLIAGIPSIHWRLEIDFVEDVG